MNHKLSHSLTWARSARSFAQSLTDVQIGQVRCCTVRGHWHPPIAWTVRIFISPDHYVRKEYSIVGIAKGMNSFEDISVVQNANY